MATLTALEIQLYCKILSHRSSASFYDSTVFDAGTYQILGIIFEQIKQIMPREGSALKIPVHIASVGCIARKLDNGQPMIRLLLPFLAAVPPPSSTLISWRFLRFLQKRCELLV